MYSLHQQHSLRGPMHSQSKCSLALLRTINEQDSIFRLNFCWDMSKVHYFSIKSSKNRQAMGGSLPPFSFDIGDLKLHDLAKLSFSNWLWRNRTLKTSIMTSFQWRHFWLRQWSLLQCCCSWIGQRFCMLVEAKDNETIVRRCPLRCHVCTWLVRCKISTLLVCSGFWLLHCGVYLDVSNLLDGLTARPRLVHLISTIS